MEFSLGNNFSVSARQLSALKTLPGITTFSQAVARSGSRRRAMIIEILVAQRQPVDALRQQLLRRVVNETPVAPVRETPRQCPGHTKACVDLPKQQHPAITGQRASRKIRHHFSRTEALKLERSLLTLC